jgi:hypothetical protein
VAGGAVRGHRTDLRAVARLGRSSGCHCLHGKSRARPVLDADAVDAVVSIAELLEHLGQ